MSVLGARLMFAGDPVPNELSTFADLAKLADGNTKN